MPETAIQTKEIDNPPIKYSKTPFKDPNLTQYEKIAVSIKQRRPELTNAELGRELNSVGASNNTKYIFQRIADSDYFKAELQAIENNHHEILLRETYPIAEKVLNRALKSRDKTLDLKGKFPYVKLAYDKVHGETHRHVAAPTINVANIERMQVVINNDLESTLDDVQKVTS